MELSLKDVIILLRQKLALILAVSVVLGGIAFAVTFFLIKPTYTATASLYVSNQNASQEKMLSLNDLNVSQSLVSTYIVIIESDTVLDKVAKQINSEMEQDPAIQKDPLTAKSIRKMMKDNAINETEAFDISITNANPVLAQKLVGAILEIAPTEIIRVVKAGAVEVIDSPALPTEAYWPVARNTLVGILIGMMLAVSYVLLYKAMDTVIHDEENLTSVFTIPVLGVIPQMHDGAEKNSGGSQK